MEPSAVFRLFGLVVGVVVAVGAGCNIAGQPCGLLNLSACSSGSGDTGSGGNVCNGGLGGYGGGGGAGGGGGEGVGGDGAGTGGGSGVSVGAGGDSSVASASASVGAGVGGGGDAWPNEGDGYVARAPRRHRGHPRGGLGRAQQPLCQVPWTFLPFPNPIPVPTGAVPLSTTRLRFICSMNGVGQGQTGILFSQACGLAFENWVLWMLQEKPNKQRIDSPVRLTKTSGLVASVIPDYWKDLKLAVQDSPMVLNIPRSFFGEVKAVAGYLPPSYSQYQILGLLDVAQLSPAGSSVLPKHPPPELMLTTTGNTKISSLTLGQANIWGVAIWQQLVWEVPAMQDDPNPDLCIDRAVPQNVVVYPPNVTVAAYRVNSTCTKLKAAPDGWVELIPGDPDPPMVDP